MLGPQRLVGEIEHLIVRRVLDGVDLLEDHVALELQVARTQHRIAHQIGEHVQRLGQVGVEYPRRWTCSPIWCAIRCCVRATWRDRKSTRLNSSHSQISYALFCLK